MKLGAFVNILDSNRHSWAEQFAFIKNHLSGVEHVELWLEGRLSPKDVKWLRDTILDSNLSVLVHAPFVGVSLASHVEELRLASVNRIVDSAHLAEALNARVLTCHSGHVGVWVPQEQALDTLARSLNEIAEKTSIAVAIENMPRRVGGSRELVTTAKDLEYVIDKTDEVGVTLDVGHCIQNGEDPIGAFQLLRPHIFNMHLHDGFMDGGAHKSLGIGELKLSDLLGVLVSVYDGHVSLETLGEKDTKQSWNILMNELGKPSSVAVGAS